MFPAVSLVPMKQSKAHTWNVINIYGMTHPCWEVMRKDSIILSVRRDISAETSKRGRGKILKFKISTRREGEKREKEKGRETGRNRERKHTKCISEVSGYTQWSR